MRNMLKATTLERKFPLLAVENGCIISKDADITVAFRVELPELFTVTSAEYEAIHSAWYKAIKVLPDYSIVHKQDFFIKENYQPDTERDELSFLSRSFERHFNERPFLNHYCYLFLTKTTRERSRRQSDFSTLCRGRIVPQEIADKEAAAKFIEAVGQFERIMNDSGFVTLTRLAASEITGQDGKAGIIEKYFSLSQTDTTCLKDIGLYPEEMRVGDDILCLHTLSDVEDLPGKVGTDTRFEKLSTDRSDCRLSFAAPVGVLLSCNHVYNQFIFIDDHAENLKNFEQTARNMQSLSRYSRANQVNKEWIDEYLNEAHSKGLVSVRCHCNVMAWSDDREELKRIRNDVGSQLALMECKPRHNTVDTPTLFWAGIPGNEADFPAEESFYTFLGQALCLFVEETNYKSSLSPFGIKMVDRVSGRPLHIDISDLPMKKGITTNRNKFILGRSGSGKSFFTNHMVRQYYEQGAHVLLSTEETYAEIAPVRLDRNGVSAFVAIMRGCDNFCSYCVVPYTRGRERSRDAETIVAEARSLFENGYREVTLLGQNVNSYRTGDVDFPELVRRVASVSPLLRVRFATSHPKDMSDGLLEVMASMPNVCRAIHLPAQSGATSMLGRMNRKYTREWYLDRIAAIRRYLPDCAITTDLIAGFSGETEEEHLQTLSLMREVGYDFAYMFKYSERPGTFAEKHLGDDVPEEVKSRRLSEIIALQNELGHASNLRDVGREFEVLVEGESKRDRNQLSGRTSQNKVVVFDRGDHRVGDYVRVRITGCTPATLFGDVISGPCN